ncbi:MAG: 2'-5' RNA ligase family protein [Thermomicrobiales bacterium]
MSIAIIMTFDTASDARIRRYWASLESRNLVIPNLGRPHLTLAQIDPDDHERAGEALADVATGIHGMVIAFDSLGVFPGEQPILFVNPVANAGLLAAHRRVHEALRKAEVGREGSQGHYLPGSWVPHVTLGRVHDASLLGEAVTVASDFRLRFTMTGIALASMRSDVFCPS